MLQARFRYIFHSDVFSQGIRHRLCRFMTFFEHWRKSCPRKAVRLWRPFRRVILSQDSWKSRWFKFQMDIYKKILRWIKWMDLRWTFWICYDLLSFSPSLRISTVTVQLSGCRSCSCWGVASTGCSKWQPSLRDVLMWFVSKMENQWKSWNGKKETRISKAMKWWMTWALNFERNFDFLAFLSTPHGDLAQSTPFRAGMSRRFTLSGRAALCLSCESAPKARKKSHHKPSIFPRYYADHWNIGIYIYIYIMW